MRLPLRRCVTPLFSAVDAEWAAGISLNNSQPIAEHGLDLGDARLLVSDSK